MSSFLSVTSTERFKIQAEPSQCFLQLDYEVNWQFPALYGAHSLELLCLTISGENLKDSMQRENNAWEFSYHHINHFQRQLEWELVDLYFPRVMKNWQRFLKKDYKVYLNRFHKGQLVQNWLILADTKGLIPIQPKAKLLGRGFWFCLPFILNLNCFPAFKGEFWYFVYSCVVVGDLIIFMENKWRALLASKPISGDGSGNSICQPGNLKTWSVNLVRFLNFEE